MKDAKPAIALLPYGDVLEDWLDPLGLSLGDFLNGMTGSWMFGYVDALREAGVSTVSICMSRTVTQPIRRVHRPSGSDVCVLPSPRSLWLARRFMLREPVGERPNIARLAGAAVRNIAPYLSTPLRHLAIELRRGSYRAVLCQEYENPRFDLTVALAGALRVPVFATFQGAMRPTKLERALRPRSIRASAGLVISARTEVERVATRYGVPASKIARISNPVDVEIWRSVDRAHARRELGISMAAQVVICHGQVRIRKKGLDILLDAWEQVSQRRPARDIRLLIVGAGPDVPELLRRIADRRLPGTYVVDKWLDRSTLRLYLSAADLYVLASRDEGFPVAPLEAMACGLPVVASNASGISEILAGGEDSGGLVVPVEDGRALAVALGRILDDDVLRLELGWHARQRVEKHFSLGVVGRQLRRFLLREGPATRLAACDDG